MKKHLLSAALLAVLGFSTIGAASAVDGKITFTGTISDQTCSVTGGTGTNGAAGDFTVTLPTVATTALSAADKVAGETPFTVVIGGSGQTGCGAGTPAKVARLHFEALSSPVSASTGRLINQAASGATKVEVELLSKDNKPINIATGENATGSEETITGNTATLKYGARYHATGGASTAGAVSTYVNYTIVYK
ncbi:fimbrial protein [Pseudoxanthomonas indica]|uniref:Major type 1 subunit fimbrin (Pilin) n=1 Tax=Pseudoxanthomonas indica TaxID=428993 RepID=A0A1T5K5E6_9GAMM|nr:fimbrial protein [Pseudoxanthomonas indica]GGD46699.1 ferrous iron transporter B [Pseudoxanthomonas indica]SKC58678.1 major type 1 subunit fimbrin (pilin) [Pseudoxanthomonas indica]